LSCLKASSTTLRNQGVWVDKAVLVAENAKGKKIKKP